VRPSRQLHGRRARRHAPRAARGWRARPTSHKRIYVSPTSPCPYRTVAVVFHHDSNGRKRKRKRPSARMQQRATGLGSCRSCGNPAPAHCINRLCWACCNDPGCQCHARSGAPLGRPRIPPPPPPPPSRQHSPINENSIKHRGGRRSALPLSGNRPPLQRLRPWGNGRGARV